jgi:ADP-heptose:LPS heptosyltransferase
MSRTVLVVRLDSMGDVLAAGPAVRAVASGADRVVMLAGPIGADAARMLPGVCDVVVFDCPWIGRPAAAVDRSAIGETIDELSKIGIDEAIVLTSFHQSPLPTALLLRLAGIPVVSASSVDYPGSLLDRRLPEPADLAEPLRMLEIVRGAGFELPEEDDGHLAVRWPLPAADPAWNLQQRYLVAHPGTAAPARAYPAELWAAAVHQLALSGWQVVLTGADSERSLTAGVALAAAAGDQVLDLGGRLELDQLAAVLSRAQAVVVGNTGPAHLAAAVRTPVVSLFAPVVPAQRWVPYGVPVVVLGDQQAACRDTRSTVCPIEGHPCLSSVTAAQIVQAVAGVVAT